MRWTKTFDTWECVFVNAPFKVVIVPTVDGAQASLSIEVRQWREVVAYKPYSSVEEAKADVNNFVLDHLALYSAQVHRECLNANVMTWRKLKEQLDQIPEDQLDEEVKVLDSSDDWYGYPEIVKANKDQFKDDDCRNVTDFNTIVDDQVLVVENGSYYLSIEL